MLYCKKSLRNHFLYVSLPLLKREIYSNYLKREAFKREKNSFDLPLLK